MRALPDRKILPVSDVFRSALLRTPVEVRDELPVGGAGGIEFLVPLGDRCLQVDDLLFQMGNASLQSIDVGGSADAGFAPCFGAEQFGEPLLQPTNMSGLADDLARGVGEVGL
ncbi:hypothetical protein Areg01_74270 [Actinoplanes regularis]|nr:hypothetical protein Areg01_74270 [Actinoplanes regularis]